MHCEAFSLVQNYPNAAEPKHSAALFILFGQRRTTNSANRKMSVQIRDLKRRYKMNLAVGKCLPTFDLAIPLPLSTGNALFDSAMLDKLSATTTMNEAEHLNRAWQMVKNATTEETATLAENARGILNDYKLLLALKCWETGDEGNFQKFLRSLPWGWRLAFPTFVIKPSAQIFTGWRKSLQFRLVENTRFGNLHETYREILRNAPPTAIMKYRSTIHEALALLHYKPSGERELAIHNWCFGNGERCAGAENLEPIATYIKARNALRTGGTKEFLDILNAQTEAIPITSFMGLLGNAKINLNTQYLDEIVDYNVHELRDYAVHSATTVETILRLNEWNEWLTDAHIEKLSEKVRANIISGRVDVPFFKIVKAFINVPTATRKRILEPLFLPLLEHFGKQVAGLLPTAAPLTFIQPCNVIHTMSFLLYTVLSSAMETRLFLLYKDGVEEVPALELKEVAQHLADSPEELQRWLLSEFGGLTSHNSYTYDYSKLRQTLGTLTPNTPLLLDLPFADSMDILSGLLPFEKVFNLNTAYGAPGEICIAYEYYNQFFFGNKAWNFSFWSRYSDSAAQKFAEFLDRLNYFQKFAAHVENPFAEDFA